MSTTDFVTMGDGTRIAYRLDGPEDRPILLLSNSIGTTLEMWDVNIPKLTEYFRVLRYDMRGHGRSDVPVGAYSIDRLGRDVIELVNALDIARFHFLGLSLGGFVGQWLGIFTPERVERLVLSNTAAFLGPAAKWDQAIADVLKAEDMKATAEMFLENWFPHAMLQSHNATVDKFRSMLMETDKVGLAGAWAVVRDTDLRNAIALINRPTMVIAGRNDTVTSAEAGKEIARRISGARLHILATVHLSNVEMPDEYVGMVRDFLLASTLEVSSQKAPTRAV